MKLSEILTTLEYGELFNVPLTGDIDTDNKGFSVEDYPVIINHLNLAILDLHTRYLLREREITIQQYEHIAHYYIKDEYALSNTSSTQDPKYIIDTEEDPFTEDTFIQVLSVYSEAGCELHVNDENNRCSVFLPDPSTIQVINPSDESTMFVICRSTLPRIPLDTVDLSYEVDLPYFIMEALTSLVASKIFSRRTSQEAQALSANLYAKYDMVCKRLEEKGLIATNPRTTNIKLGERGWL